ncbi:histidine kinase [Ekhidna sp.]|uniref:sensor histidine kinase n=1 Tax=Ekhidna sp. TaxID=2608089 RepID=UPI003298FABD
MGGSFAFSQNDYHFFLGSDELSGIDIYGINQTPDHVFWITTNKGLFSFDGYKFQNYSHPEQKSSSLFNPTINYKGEIFFNNFSGQIFTIGDGQLKLVHTVPDSLLGAYVNFDFLPDNQLIISSRKCYRLVENQISVIENVRSYSGAIVQLGRLSSGNLIINYSGDSVAIVDEQGYEIRNRQIELEGVLHYFMAGNKMYASEPGEAKIFEIDSIEHDVQIKIILDADEPGRIYASEGNLWLASNRFGIKNYDLRNVADSERIMFPNYFISYLFQDDEDNILLGTFGNGIIVIPGSHMQLIKWPEDVRFSRIATNGAGGLYLGSTNGHVFEWRDGDYTILSGSSKKLIEILEFFPENNHLVTDLNSFDILDVKAGKHINASLGSVKDVVSLGPSNYAIGTHSHVARISVDPIKTRKIFSVGRTSSLEYNSEAKELIVATIQGLVRIDSLDRQFTIGFRDNNFLVNDLVHHKGKMLVATQKFGVLAVENDSLVRFLDKKNGLISDNVWQVQSLNDTLYISSEQGFQIFDPDLANLTLLGESDGLISKKVRDFQVDTDYIWFLNQTGLQRLSKKFLKDQKDWNPKIQEVLVTINDRRVSEVSFTVPFEENEIKFEIMAPSLARMADLSYVYRLNEGSWNENPYELNSVVYRALTFGDHTFQTQLKYKGQIIDEKSIEFRVEAPFYFTWWFIGGAILVFVVGSYAIYQVRLKAQSIRSNQLAELNASKLTALQSQMNPHFIFNALNSIQEYIMLNERKLAGKYLGKFADLMRIYLQFSQAKFITIDDEITALKLFLELEKLRFEDTLKYQLIVDEKISLEKKIPAMLIQPYVENALLHGLLHKEFNKILKISFETNDAEGNLICLIEDNGIGRKRSLEINRSRNPNHQSFATSATKQRLSLINKDLKREIGEETVDLYDEDGSAIGTKVKLTIPTS